MPILSSADMAGFRALNAELAFHDPYRVERATETPDGRGGRTTTWNAVESGTGNLERGGLRGETKAVAERLGWSAHYDIDLPYDTIAEEEDRIKIGNRTFVIGYVHKAEVLEIAATAVCRETG